MGVGGQVSFCYQFPDQNHLSRPSFLDALFFPGQQEHSLAQVPGLGACEPRPAASSLPGSLTVVLEYETLLLGFLSSR